MAMTRVHRAAGRWLAALLLAAAACLPPPAAAHTEADALLPEVGVDEKLGGAVPPSLSFADAGGRQVRLSDYFEGGTPVLLTLNYYACPMLCPLTFRNLTGTIKAMSGLSLARDYRVVTVSIDPEEVPELAQAKMRETYAMLPGTPGLAARWPFLMGKAPEIGALARAVGMRYTRLGEHNYAHPTLAVVLTPEGRISRYFYDLDIRPNDLRLALIEAAGGRIGNPVLNRVLLYCYHYDPAGRRYALIAVNVMKVAGAATALLLALLLLALRRREGGKGGGAA
jgi:protein SCO1/2